MPNYRQAAQQIARKYGIDPGIFVRQIGAESGFNPGARSPAGAQGIAQFIPSTARQYGVNVNDPISSLDGAARLMRDSLRRNGGSYAKALSVYNSGRPDGYLHIAETRAYVAKILQGSNPTGTPSASPSTSVAPSTSARTITTAGTPGVDNSGARSQLIAQFLGRRDQDPVSFALGIRGLADVAATPGSTRTSVSRTPAAGSDTSAPGAAPSGPGSVKITGPNPGRIKPSVLTFARQISAIYGKPVVGSDGSGHSRLTVDGNVSQHTTGNATDIPAAGAELKRMGRAALEAAGMPRAQAQKAQGGLYNINGHQVIFLTNQGGNHFDHLHVSAR